MTVTVPSFKTVDTSLPANGFGVPDIYVGQSDKDKDADRLLVDGDGDYEKKLVRTRSWRFMSPYIYMNVCVCVCVYVHMYVCILRCPTGPFPVSPVPVLAGEVAHRYRL
jgi:hypothetical protein